MLITRENCQLFESALAGFSMMRTDLNSLRELVRELVRDVGSWEGVMLCFEVIESEIHAVKDRIEESVGYNTDGLIPVCLEALSVTVSAASGGSTTEYVEIMDALSMSIRTEAARVVIRKVDSQNHSVCCRDLADAVLALGELAAWKANAERGLFLAYIADQLRKAALSLTR